MPIYEYRCLKCDKEFELTVNYKDFYKVKYCPNCNSTDVERLISKTSFILKGSCWANDGYSGSKNKCH